MSTSDGPGPPQDPGEPLPPGSGERRGYLYLADEVRKVREGLAELRAQLTDVAEVASVILPRIDEHQSALERAGISLAAGGPVADGGWDTDDLTPATRWSHLGRDELNVAWRALGEWVGDVANGEYRLNRIQLPDCWPVHPWAVRELAWLRTLHVATLHPAVPVEAVAEWHSRWLPAALYNISRAVDARECAPGRHRLTEAERHNYHTQRSHDCHEPDPRGMEPLDEAPGLSAEGGAYRPRYFPGLMPARRSTHQNLASPRPRDDGPEQLDEATPPPVSEPHHWRPYFLDAWMAELATAGRARDPDPLQWLREDAGGS